MDHRSLVLLILSRNKLFAFPSNGSFLLSKSLEIFECVSCGISSIYKETFSEIPKLRELNLSRNNLSVITSGTFDRSFLLRNLNLDFNSLTTIPSDLLSRSAVNATLSMNHNSDYDFGTKEVFLKSKNLIEFQCSHCGIFSIYEETFSELPNIAAIYLNDNNISVIHSKMFVKNGNIGALLLERNNLKDFPMNIFDVIMKLKTLCIDGNPFVANAISAMRKYYVKAKLRSLFCTYTERENYFENAFLSQNDSESSTDINPTKNKGISDAFIASYLLIILVAQAAVIGFLIMYWFKIVLTDKIDEFDYSSNVLNDHDIYDVS